jgi:hypothetical protein
MKTNLIKHLFLSLLVFLCWMAIILCGVTYAFLTTPWGARIASTYLIQSYIPFCDVKVGGYEGTIEKGLVLKDVSISHIPNLRDGTVHIQDLYVQIPLIHWDQLAMRINNGSINLTQADPIIFNVSIIQNKLQGNCYAHSIDARQVVSVLGYDDLAKSIYGFISHLDFVIAGTVDAPRLVGHFFVDKFIYKTTTTVQDGFGHLDLKIPSLGDHPTLLGFLILESAAVKVEKINVDLTTSKVDFKGEVDDLLLDIHGSSKVEDINIDLAVKGTFKRPTLLLNSDPPMSEDQILVALATNKSWSEIDQAQGFGLRKKLTDVFNVGMQVEEMPSQVGHDQSQGYSRTLEGQMNVTDKLSVNVSKKYLPANESTSNIGASSQPQKDNESEIYLQYKQRF